MEDIQRKTFRLIYERLITASKRGINVIFLSNLITYWLFTKTHYQTLINGL